MLKVCWITRFMVRVGALMRVSTHGWHPADELEFQQSLPTGTGWNRLPTMETLQKGTVTERDIRQWEQTATRLESLVHANDPWNPKRMLRDMARGRFPL